MRMNKAVLFFLLLFGLTIFVFHSIFYINFTADDYFVLQMVKTKNFTSFIRLFLPLQNVVYYRPLGIQLYFWLSKVVFAMNPFPYHLLGFFIHTMNIFLVFLIIKKITASKLSAFMATFLYGISVVHFLSLAWVVNFSYLLVTFFYFLAFFLWLESKTYPFLLVVSLGLLTNELMITLPIVLFFYSILFNKKSRSLIPASGLVLVYFLLRFLFFKTASGGDYSFTLNPKIIANNYQWYILWSFGWPETMRDQMINFFTRNPGSDFLINFKKEFIIFIIGFYSMLLLLVISNFKKIINKQTLFSVIFFSISLIPVIFFRSHSYPHYSTIGLLGIVLFVSLSFKNIKNRFVQKVGIISFLFIWFFVSQTAVNLNMKVHWIVWHSQLSQKLITDAKKAYKPGQQEIIVRGDVKRNKIVLANQSAMRVIFNSDTIKTIFIP